MLIFCFLSFSIYFQYYAQNCDIIRSNERHMRSPQRSVFFFAAYTQNLGCLPIFKKKTTLQPTLHSVNICIRIDNPVAEKNCFYKYRTFLYIVNEAGKL